MSRPSWPLFACLLALAMPGVCLAQDSHRRDGLAQSALDQHYLEMVDWLERYTEWESWIRKWGNRVAYNAAGGMIKKRPTRPEPPAWLWADCERAIPSEGKLDQACRILAHWHDVGQLILDGRSVGSAARTDVPVKSSFLQRIHLSGGWVPAQLPAPKVYLVAGMQIGIVEVGRATLPAVGVGLMALADGSGGYEWKPATVVGIGYRLSTFPFPGIKRQAHLHINVARATIHGIGNVPLGLDPSQNLVGFSLTFQKAR